MAQGIGLLHIPGPGGLPRTLVLRDVWRRCSLCGHEDGQRIFDELPTHTLGLATLRRYADHVRHADAWPCPQCDEPLRAEDGLRHAIHLPVSGGTATLSAWEDADEGLRWQAAPLRPFDVQRTPTWAPEEDIAAPIFETLDASHFEEAFGRPLSAKEALRAALVSLLREGPPASEARLLVGDRHFGVVVGGGRRAPSDEGVRAALQALAPLTASWEVARLLEEGELASGWPASPAEWLADLPQGWRERCWIAAAASPGAVLATAEAQLALLPVRARLRPRSSEDGFEVVVGSGEEGGALFEPAQVAREAARTLLHPCDAARIELDRLLLFAAGAAEGLDE